MKRIAKGIRKLNEHVANAGNIAHSAARQIEEIRHTVANTTGQLQSLRAELPQWANDLHAGSEERIAEALSAVNQCDDLLDQAGFALAGIDLEISPAHRVIVHLMMIREVSPRQIDELAQAEPLGVRRALLGALAKAREMGQTFAPDGLPDHRVQIGLGPIPTVRLVWRNESAQDPAPSASSEAQEPAATGNTFSSSLGQSPGAFFGSSATIRLAEASLPTPSAPARPAVPAPAAPSLNPAEPPPEPVDPLARFKVMPFKTR